VDINDARPPRSVSFRARSAKRCGAWGSVREAKRGPTRPEPGHGPILNFGHSRGSWVRAERAGASPPRRRSLQLSSSAVDSGPSTRWTTVTAGAVSPWHAPCLNGARASVARSGRRVEGPEVRARAGAHHVRLCCVIRASSASHARGLVRGNRLCDAVREASRHHRLRHEPQILLTRPDGGRIIQPSLPLEVPGRGRCEKAFRRAKG
jgi:hypothetical protein